MSKVQLGTVSHGTLLNRDLIPAFYETLFDINPAAIEPILEAYPEYSACADENGDSPFFDSEDGESMLESLIEALNEQAPPFCYFGTLEGDGSDFGFWLSEDAIRDAEYDGDLMRIYSSRRNRPEYIAEVNDHGNLTLYSVTYSEIFSIV